MFQKSKLSLAVAAAIAGTSALYVSPTVQAQDVDEEVVVEEVVVTGSRIRRKDFISNSPIATLGEQELKLTGTVNTESLLNKLPQAVPGLDRTSNNPGNGTATVNLRGLGANRTLVLINGRRATPTTSGGVVDINQIPNALIKDIEVVTGGASAVYGSDAISGVVNFILKDDFEGISFSAGYEVTEEGDGDIFNADLTMGGNFADGRGNAVISFSYTDRDDVFQGDRDFAETALFDNANLDGLEPGGSSGVPATSIFSGGFAGFSPTSFGVIFNPNGSLRPFVSSGQVNDFYNYAPVNYLQLPQERRQANALIDFDINDGLTAYGEFKFSSSDVPSQLAPTPIFQTSTFTIDGSPFLTPDAQRVLSDAIGSRVDGQLVDANGNGIADTGRALIRRRLLEVGPRISDDEFQSYTATFGMKGDIGNTDWQFDTYYQVGNVSRTTTQLGNVSRQRFQQALLLNAGGGCQDSSNNGATVPCAPINIFGQGNISAAGAAFLRTAVTSSSDFDQTLFGFNVSGEIANIGVAAGYEYREDEFVFRPSQALASGDIAGFNGAPAVSGEFDVNELFVEALVPIVKDIPAIQNLEVELAYRYSDYSTIGGVSTYKVSPSWTITDQVRIRGGYNRAVRAPNIGELFSPQSENFPSASDPCSNDNGVPSAEVAAICRATGVPAGVIGSAAIAPASGQVRAFGGGNPNLSEETADTITIGLVVSPIDGLTLSLDYFDIDIEDAVGAIGANSTLATCYDPALGGVGSDACNAINRRADGTIDFVEVFSQNIAVSRLEGYDLQADYSTELFNGNVDIKYLGTYTDSSESSTGGGATLECAGFFGQSCGTPLPEYKHRMTFAWSNDKFNAQLTWEYIGGVDDDTPEQDFTVERISAESYFNLASSYNYNDNYSFTFGIKNLFDTDPPVIGGNDQQANTYPNVYDVFGRTYYANFRAEF